MTPQEAIEQGITDVDFQPPDPSIDERWQIAFEEYVDILINRHSYRPPIISGY